MMKKSGIECQIPPGFEGMTIIFCARNDAIAGVIGAGDTLRDEAARTVADLQKLGLHCIMLTGDNIHAAELCAKNCGITEFYASLTPAGKVEKIREIAGKTSAPVIMTGDGINDAPALAQSDAGIAIGSGTAAALESAGIILPGSRLDTVVDVIALSHAVFRVIKQNLFWAFFYNFGAIPVAAGLTAALGGISLNPAICAGTMAASSLTVVLNALRLLKFRSRKNG